MRTLFLALLLPAFAQDRDDDDDREELETLKSLGYLDTPDFSATPGGAQDIGYFRDRVAAGEVPHPNVFTPEGLFGEHDLPLTGSAPCAQLLCPIAAATPARLMVQPEVRWLAQVGFDSGLKEFTRAPLNLVAVVDKSGSMSGEPLETVKASLSAVVAEMGPEDQLSIVLYGDVVEVRLPPTRASRAAEINRVIQGIASAGSTDMESGLRQGYTLAQATAKDFVGTTRVMLFTDERPNVGATDAGSFMGMARQASQAGVGLTTIGVGVQFGAELASAISSVRGGNLYFFSSVPEMRKTFAEEFDFLVTELAYDFTLTVHPAPGLRVTGLYGIPGDLVKYTPEGDLQLTVETLFLSKQEGAIYVSFGEDGPLPYRGGPLGTIDASYEERGGARRSAALSVAITSTPELGLVRGVKLVNEATVLREATALHHEKNDQEGAFQLVHALAGSQAGDRDPDLANERTLVTQLDATLAKLSGHQGEGRTTASRDRINGLPR